MATNQIKKKFFLFFLHWLGKNAQKATKTALGAIASQRAFYRPMLQKQFSTLQVYLRTDLAFTIFIQRPLWAGQPVPRLFSP